MQLNGLQNEASSPKVWKFHQVAQVDVASPYWMEVTPRNLVSRAFSLAREKALGNQVGRHALLQRTCDMKFLKYLVNIYCNI